MKSKTIRFNLIFLAVAVVAMIWGTLSFSKYCNWIFAGMIVFDIIYSHYLVRFNPSGKYLQRKYDPTPIKWIGRVVILTAVALGVIGHYDLLVETNLLLCPVFEMVMRRYGTVHDKRWYKVPPRIDETIYK